MREVIAHVYVVNGRATGPENTVRLAQDVPYRLTRNMLEGVGRIVYVDRRVRQAGAGGVPRGDVFNLGLGKELRRGVTQLLQQI